MIAVPHGPFGITDGDAEGVSFRAPLDR